MRLAACCAAFGLLPASALAGQDLRAQAVFEGLVRPDEPGLAVLVRRAGQTVFERGWGLRDLRSRERIDEHTAFRLASLTKAFTATAIELLVRDGKLHYDDPITSVLPAFPAYGRGITIRQLLNHTSGLPDYEQLMEAAQKGRAPIWTAEHQISDDEVLALLRDEKSGRFAPGTSWAYSNSGYVLLGLVAARVSGRPFADLLRERIFEPLRMRQTVAYQKGRGEIKDRAFGHTRADGGFHEADQRPTSATLGDGGVYSNLEDLAKWDEALSAHSLLSPSALKPALTPVRLADGSEPRWPEGPAGGDDLEPGRPVSYGFGWFLDPWRGRPRQWHHGTTIGFRTVVERFSDDRLTVVILSNRDDLSVRSLAQQVGDLYLAPRR